MMSKSNAGRPTVMTEEVLRILEKYLKLDAATVYACHEAGISETAFYDYQKDNPKFAEKVKSWRQDTMTVALQSEKILLADQNPTVVTNYLNKKDKTRKDRYEGTELTADISVEEYIEQIKRGELESFNDIS